jgi:hypothetical protein
VELHAESAAIDLRSAQLDQLEQLLVEAGLASRLARRRDYVIALQLPFLQISESMGNHDSKIVDAASVD